MLKYRHENKYIISNKDALFLKQRLSYLMDVDTNSVNKDHSYYIKSLYFDDYKNSAYYEKLDGVLYRKKYRIRTYNDDDKFIRLEKKMKHNNLTAKEQTKIDKDVYYDIINGNDSEIDTFGDKLLEEFLLEKKYNKLSPSIVVSYKRTAYTYRVSNVRITFDEIISSGMYNYDILNKDNPNYIVLGDKELVLEVKYDEILPESIKMILETVPMYKMAVSKFAICRSIK